MIIAAIADLETLTEDLIPFEEALKNIKKPDLFLLAGDMYDYREPKQYKEIVSLIRKQKFKCPIIAVLGNREFQEDEAKIRKYAGKDVTFLNDESITLKIKNKTVGIVGSRGCLDKPTFWQLRSIKGIYQLYKKRFHKLSDLLKKLDTNIKILLTHYAPTYETLRGEEYTIFPGLGSKYFEKVLIETKTTLAVHGHAERGIDLGFIDSIPVFNVAYPVTRKITIINTNKLPKPL